MGYKDVSQRLKQANTKEELEAARKYIDTRLQEICNEYNYIGVLSKVLEPCKQALIKEYEQKSEV